MHVGVGIVFFFVLKVLFFQVQVQELASFLTFVSRYRCMQELGLFSFFSFLFFCLDVQTGSLEPSVMDKSHDSCAAAFLFIQLFNVRGSIASKSFVQLLTGQFNWINLSFRCSLILI